MYTMHENTYWPTFKKVFDLYQPKTIVEIGTYYGGLSYRFHELLGGEGHVFGVQTPDENKLIHVPDSNMGDYSAGEADGNIDTRLGKHDWKRAVKKYFPEKYHHHYDFNLVIETFQNMEHGTLVLDTSPFKYPWKFGYDLCILDITTEVEENERQVDYWIKYGNEGSVLMVGAWTHQDEFYELAKQKYGFLTKDIFKEGSEHVLLCL